ncbi:MAG: M48 family metallopeptidase [Planctomycetes bacterium]|nr:M48 family metallopeptidase [Planctomycetota bacterium]
MKKSNSFFGRIVLALILMVGFYLFAIGIAAILILLPVAEIVFANRFHPKLALLSVIGGLMILWSILPRWDRFIPPGPRLSEKEQPELFRALQSVANATNQQMPAEVYALPEMNAWVTSRGGMMGIGSRRVMGIGVPLMQVLSTQQFRGVLAHEFGHYYGGDTKLGPWIFVTRSAIIRTVVNLGNNGSSVLMKPFEWYMMLFLWLTQKVSRQQEFTADALAAETVGPKPIAEALKVTHTHSALFQAYWDNVYAPILQDGYQAPMAQGFRMFIRKTQDAADELLSNAMKEQQSSIYDSHPALKDRLDAIAKIHGPEPLKSDPPAIQLIRDVEKLETEMISTLARSIGEKVPRPISWEDVSELVTVPDLVKYLKFAAGKLDGVQLWQAAEMFDAAEHREKLLSDLIRSTVSATAAQSGVAVHTQVSTYAARLLAVWMLLALRGGGWTIRTVVAEAPIAEKDGIEFEPFSLVEQLLEKKINLAAFQDRLEELGIDEIEWDSLIPAEAPDA